MLILTEPVTLNISKEHYLGLESDMEWLVFCYDFFYSLCAFP